MKIKEVIVGGCVHALIKCYMDSTPIVLTSTKRPTIDLKFNKTIEVEQLRTERHSEAWSMLKFLCAMRGLIVNHQDLDYVRVDQDKVSFRGGDIEYKKCHLFPDSAIKTGLEIVRTDNENQYKIIDFMRLKFCDASNLVPVLPKDTFISLIESTGKKELYSLSYLKKEQLTDFDYSDTMVRFIVQKLLLNNEGVHRPLIHKGSEARRIPKLEVTERLVIPMEEVVYGSTKKIKFYDREKRSDIIKTYSRDNPSLEDQFRY